MRRLATAAAAILACAACTDGPDGRGEAPAAAVGAIDGPVPDGTVVDVPMDSIPDEDMDERNEHAPIEGKIVESER